MGELTRDQTGQRADALEEAATHRGQRLISVEVDETDLNLKRFSMGPVPEVVLRWWDHTVVYKVRRERSGHQVLINEDVTVDWTWHIVFGAVTGVAITLGSMLFGMPVLYALMLGVLLALIVIGLVRYERSVSEDTLDELYRSTTKIDGSAVLVLDEPVWEDVKAVIAEVYDTALDIEHDEHAGGPRLPQWLRRFRPIPTAAMNDVLAEMRLQLDKVRLSRYHRTLRRSYEKDTELLAEMGTGTRDCRCQACELVIEEGLSEQVTVPGSVKALERARGRIAVGTPVQWETPAMAKAEKDKARAQVEKMEKRRKEREEREKKRLQHTKAKEYVAERKKLQAQLKHESRARKKNKTAAKEQE